MFQHSVIRRVQTLAGPMAGLAAALSLIAAAPAAAAAPSSAPARSSKATSRPTAATAASPSAALFFIRGGGFGHGVGMSQYGAYGYALHGQDYRFILAHYYTGTALGQVDPDQIVRVLVKTGSAAFSGATEAGSTHLNPAWTYTVTARADGSLVIADPSGHSVGKFPALLSVTGPGPLQVAGLGSYHGALEFRPDHSGGVQTVNALALDDYVRGVVAAEMPSSWPTQALEAQAVAARSYALTTSVVGDGYSLYSDTRSQMYGGVGAETAATDAAVAATRGQVVTYHGNPVATYFFSSSGGHTENNEDVWPGATPEPWLRGVSDPYDGAGGDPYHRWGYTLSLPAAGAKLRTLLKGQLIGIRVLRHGASPRILLSQVVGSRGATEATGGQLQHAFGLLTTYATFTTITTASGAPGAASDLATVRPSWVPARAAEDAVTAVLPALKGLVPTVRGLHGTVFPGQAGQPIAVQQLSAGKWHTVAGARLGRGGIYAVRLARAGRYRVVFGGLNGPALGVS